MINVKVIIFVILELVIVVFFFFNFVDGFLVVILKWFFVLFLVDRFFCEEVFLVVYDVLWVNDDVVVFFVLLMC